MAETLPFETWFREMSLAAGCVVLGREGERIYVVKVDSHASGLFFCLNVTTDTAWICCGNQLGHWFQATTPVSLLRVEPEYLKAWARHLETTE